MAAPAPGAVVDGYRFKGGNPNDRGSWEQVGRKPAKLATREMMALDEARAAARQADEAARTAEQFVDINRKQNTGGIWAIPGVGKVVGAFDSEVNQLNALQARMAPQQRVPGSGTTSDRDLSLYLSAVPGIEKPGPANSAIARQARADAQRRGQYAQFLDRYAQQNGSLIGAEEAWSQQQRARPAARQAPRPAGRPQRITDQRQFEALPSGTVFIAPDGTQRRKP